MGTTNKGYFGDRIRELRLEKGVTQREVAEELGTTDRYYRKYEAGEIEPSASYLIKLANYYGVTTDYLLGLAPASVASFS